MHASPIGQLPSRWAGTGREHRLELRARPKQAHTGNLSSTSHYARGTRCCCRKPQNAPVCHAKKPMPAQAPSRDPRRGGSTNAPPRAPTLARVGARVPGSRRKTWVAVRATAAAGESNATGFHLLGVRRRFRHQIRAHDANPTLTTKWTTAAPSTISGTLMITLPSPRVCLGAEHPAAFPPNREPRKLRHCRRRKLKKLSLGTPSRPILRQYNISRHVCSPRRVPARPDHVSHRVYLEGGGGGGGVLKYFPPPTTPPVQTCNLQLATFTRSSQPVSMMNTGRTPD
jgi:hypothetical protein